MLRSGTGRAAGSGRAGRRHRRSGPAVGCRACPGQNRPSRPRPGRPRQNRCAACVAAAGAAATTLHCHQGARRGAIAELVNIRVFGQAATAGSSCADRKLPVIFRRFHMDLSAGRQRHFRWNSRGLLARAACDGELTSEDEIADACGCHQRYSLIMPLRPRASHDPRDRHPAVQRGRPECGADRSLALHQPPDCRVSSRCNAAPNRLADQRRTGGPLLRGGNTGPVRMAAPVVGSAVHSRITPGAGLIRAPLHPPVL